MTARPRIIVSQRVDDWSDRNEKRDALDQRLCQWISAAGCQPVPIPNCLGDPQEPQTVAEIGAWFEATTADAVLLSGGNDVGEVPERDFTERCLLDIASSRALPALGICRGMQMMCVWAGGRLARVDAHVATRHRLRTETGFGDWPTEVNSYHNQGLEACPPDFIAAAYAEDGTIEAICHQDLPWEGWMWHPEREEAFGDTEINRLRRLLESGDFS